MKNKTLKLLIPIFLVFSLSSCLRGNNGESNSESSVEEESSIVEESQSNGETSSEKHSHKWEIEESNEATCDGEGIEVSRCTVCGDVKTTHTEPLGHQFEYFYTQSEPQCEMPGVEIHQCVRCGQLEQREVAAKGHQYGEVKLEQHTTCTTPGSGTQKCTVCGNTITVTEAEYGHYYELISPNTEPEQGKCKTYLYSCTRCEDTYMGFKAQEVTNSSKQHLVFTDDGGARFWGQPIGNSMELDENGNAYGADDEKIFDSNQTGDYFEYVFDLTKEEASYLSYCLLYCEAQAANYLSGQDFWAANPNLEEWTPGYYIDGEHAGEPISYYRYALYVDDVFQDFDPTMASPVTGKTTNQPLKEYVLPYRFKLHEGTNKIRLHMAGGYRSTFYNFNFRPDTDHVHAWTEGNQIIAEGKSTYTIDKCTCGKYRVNLDIVDLDGVITTKGGKIMKNGYSARYAFDFNMSCDAELWVKGTVDNVGNISSNYGFYTGKNGSHTATTLPDGKTNVTFKVNGTELLPPINKSYKELGMTSTEESGAATFKIGKANLINDTNEFIVTRNDSFGILYYELFFVFSGEMKDNFLVGQKASNSALREITNSKGDSCGYELWAEDLTEGQKAPIYGDKATQLGRNGICDDIWNITGIKEGGYNLYIEGAVTNEDVATGGYWDTAIGIANGVPIGNHGTNDPNLLNDYKFKVKIDDGDYVNVGNRFENYYSFGITGSDRNWTNQSVATLNISNDASSITLHKLENGYFMYIFAIRLIRIA